MYKSEIFESIRDLAHWMNKYHIGFERILKIFQIDDAYEILYFDGIKQERISFDTDDEVKKAFQR